MKSQVEDDTDDDPIKLFDPEHDRVYFGCHLLKNGDRDIIRHCQDDENVTYKSDAELSETSDTHVEDFRDCVPVCVKLVDCKKFPWYYRKYTQQIIEKTHFYEYVSDSDEPEFISDSNDEDFKQPIIENTIHCPWKTWFKVNYRTKAEKRLKTMKFKENLEVQTAIQCRNINKIDFKRNTGLIGMTITQKNNKTVEHRAVNHKTIKSKEKLAKRRPIPADPGFLRTAHKMLSGVGTELIAIGADVENNTVANDTTSTNNDCKDANNKIPVQFSLEKISKHLLTRITSRKSRDSLQNDELKNYEYDTCIDINMDNSNESPSPIKDKNSSSHVKNIKKTNKFKNSQIKAIEKMVMGLHNSEIEKETPCKRSINMDQTDDINHSPTKIIDDVREPNSPILPCSSLTKKHRDTNEIKKNVTDKANNCSQPINKAKHISDLYSLENINRPTVQSYNTNTTNTKLCTNSKEESFKSSPKLHDISEVVGTQFIEDRLIAKELKEDNGCDKFLTKSKDSENKKNDTNSKDEPINRPICIVSIKNNCTQNKSAGNVNHNNINSNILTTSTNVCQNKPKATVSDVNKLTQFINTIKQYPTSTSNELVNNTLNGDAPRSINNAYNVANPYASAIILRPNPQPDSRMPLRFSQPNFEPRVPNPIQPQLHQNPYFANFQTPHTQTPPQPPLISYCGPDQRLIPRSANCAIPNYRFPPPHMLAQYDNRYQTPCYPTPYQTMSNKGQQSSAFLKKGISKQIFPGTGPQTPQGSCNTFGIRPQSKSILQKNNIPQISISQINNIPQINNVCQISKNTKINNITQINNMAHLNNASSVKRTVVGSKGSMAQKIKIDSFSSKSEAISSMNSGKLNACKRHKESSDKIDLIEMKAKMLEVLNRATDKSKMCYENGLKKVVEEVGIAFKRPRLSNKAPVDDQKQVELQNGYSAPILPIPTYEKLMIDQRIVDLPKQDIIYTDKKASGKKKNEKSNSRVDKMKSQGGIRKDDTKKISLEEYKKRTFKMQGKLNGYNKKVCWNLKGNDNKRIVLQNKNRRNIDRFSTESDLGYDSDSTVIL